jgi:glycosyltransferase involved in cell wall biosynthesis
MNEIRLAICASGELYGGVEQFIFTFAQQLKNKRKVKFVVLLFNKGLLYEKVKELGVPVEVIYNKFKYDLTAVLKIRKILKKNDIHILHVHGYKATILAGIAATSLGIKIVKTEHGMLEHSKGSGYIKMSFNLYMDKLISRYFLDGIIFVSKDIQRRRKKTYKQIKKYVIPNGIAPVKEVKNEIDEIDKGFFNVGIVGRVSEVKGHIYLILAVKRLIHIKKIRLYVFGDGPLENKFKEYCNKNGLREKVFFMGFKKNIYDYMSKLNLLVMPSLHEGIPYTILEAMYMRIPVIASAVGGLKEVIKDDYEGILVPPKNDVSIANAIERLYKDRELKRFFAKNAYNKVCSEFLVSGMIGKYIETYCEILQFELREKDPLDFVEARL